MLVMAISGRNTLNISLCTLKINVGFMLFILNFYDN